jgi:hypothetical protein
MYEIQKDSGGYRQIMSFTIPDAAISNLFNQRLRDRNRNILSPFCYSYRRDRGVFDAVLQLSSFLSGDKSFVVQFDFSRYFDTIEHAYIKFLLDKKLFFVSPAERHVIETFLIHRYAKMKQYISGQFEKRSVGVPQGSSLSLFLSNIAAHELDKELERTQGMFVRFADDIVCVTQDHGAALNIVDLFKKHGYFSGIRINYQKSPGISLMEPESAAMKRNYFYDGGDIGSISEIKEFDYIGHKFRGRHILMSTRGIKRVKRRISKIAYIHLLHNLRKRALFNRDRVGDEFYDWDLVTCVNEIKRYLYGGLQEEQLKRFVEENVRINRFRGLMSFYPLVTSVEQFRELDGWLIDIVLRALKERYRILKEKWGIDQSLLTKDDLINGTWYQYQRGIRLETRVPSFVLAWRAARKAFKQYGLTDFDQPNYYSLLTSFGYSDT